MNERLSENKLTIRNSRAKLFDADRRTIGEHLQNIYSSGKLQTESVIRHFRITAFDNRNYNTLFYNLDAMKGLNQLCNVTLHNLFCRKNNLWLN